MLFRSYHRTLIKSVHDVEAEYKTKAISKYVLEILDGINHIFDILPSELTIIFELLSDKAGYITA